MSKDDSPCANMENPKTNPAAKSHALKRHQQVDAFNRSITYFIMHILLSKMPFWSASKQV